MPFPVKRSLRQAVTPGAASGSTSTGARRYAVALVNREMPIKTTKRPHSTPGRVAVIKKAGIKKGIARFLKGQELCVGEEVGMIEPPHTLLVGMEHGVATLKSSLVAPKE